MLPSAAASAVSSPGAWSAGVFTVSDSAAAGFSSSVFSAGAPLTPDAQLLKSAQSSELHVQQM